MTDLVDDPYYFQINNAEISIDDDGWLAYSKIKTSIARVIKNEELGVLLTNDEHIQQLNKDFRSLDKPTNVLSFPQNEGGYLGDIAISLETIVTEAKDEGKDFYHHFIHMLVHGLLHLQGYDHLSDDEANEMEALEVKILADIDIKNPYI